MAGCGNKAVCRLAVVWCPNLDALLRLPMNVSKENLGQIRYPN
tara:strand:- start:568 stop:696 length:129 start_codon:yes stop_codon:yes gene_type:complete